MRRLRDGLMAVGGGVGLVLALLATQTRVLGPLTSLALGLAIILIVLGLIELIRLLHAVLAAIRRRLELEYQWPVRRRTAQAVIAPREPARSPTRIARPYDLGRAAKPDISLTIREEQWFDFPDKTSLAVRVVIMNSNPRWSRRITKHRWNLPDYGAVDGAELQVEGGLYSISVGELKAGQITKGIVQCPIQVEPGKRPTYELMLLDDQSNEIKAVKEIGPD